MKNGQIHHVEYYVNDLDRSNQFWGWLFEVLGWKFLNHFSNTNTGERGSDWEHESGTYIVFVQVKDSFLSVQNNRQGSGLNHLAFHLEPEISKDELVNQLETRGAKIIYNEDNYLCFEDVNGFAVEFYLK